MPRDHQLKTLRFTRWALCSLALMLGACAADAKDSSGSRAAASGSGASVGTTANPAPNGLITVTSGNGAARSAGNSAPGTCASGMQTTSPVTPTVWLIVDGSSSMDQTFEGATSRWLALRSTLMDPGGVVDALQRTVRFGLVIYAGGDPANCVQLVTVDPALDNLSRMAAQYPMAPLAMGTPTHKALEYVVNNLPVLNQGMLDQTSGPVYVVLATDGAPNDNCGTGGGGRQNGNAAVEQRVVDITTQGTQQGMQMFVVSLAGGDNRLQSHLEAVASATASKTPPFVPSTKSDLITAFQEIVGGASCLVALDGRVEDGSECAGSVLLNSVALQCNDANGWSLFNRSTVQLEGDACAQFLAHQSMVTAKFPCNVFSPN